MKKMFTSAISSNSYSTNFGLFLLRVFIGIMMLTHGLEKVASFSELSSSFPDPIGLGSTLSLVMIIGAEVGCSLLLIFGILTRLATIPLIFSMLVAAFVVHANMPLSGRELPLMYLGIYVVLLFTGAGGFSVDRIIYEKLTRR